MNKKTIFIILIFFTSVSLYSQQQIPKIGIINYSKIMADYVPDPKLFDEINRLVKNYESGVESIKNDIYEMEKQRLYYIDLGRNGSAERLEEQIKEKKNYLQQYSKIKQENINRKKASILNSSAFLSEILTEIKYVAESEGYSLIFDSRDQNIIWWSQGIDITELVIKRLNR